MPHQSDEGSGTVGRVGALGRKTEEVGADQHPGRVVWEETLHCTHVGRQYLHVGRQRTRPNRGLLAHAKEQTSHESLLRIQVE